MKTCLHGTQVNCLKCRILYNLADHKHSKATTIEYIWGYKELALNDRHALGLMERENKDIEIFLKRKAEMDEFEEL